MKKMVEKVYLCQIKQKKNVKPQEFLGSSIGLSVPKILTKTCKFIIDPLIHNVPKWSDILQQMLQDF